MRKDKDADKTDTMDVLIIFILVQITYEKEKVTIKSNEEF